MAAFATDEIPNLMKDGGYDLGLLAVLEEVRKMLTNESTFEADERVEKIKENVEAVVPQLTLLNASLPRPFRNAGKEKSLYGKRVM